MRRMVIFGLGYTASRIAQKLETLGWEIHSTGKNGTMPFDDEGRVAHALAEASHVLSSVPPVGGSDIVLDHYGPNLSGKWLGYLSSTGVYGDTGGAWVDESAPTGSGRRQARAIADARWGDAGAHIFRLPGIYGPGRSALDKVQEGKAHRLDIAGQVFSRIHVDDIARAVIAGLDAPAGVYNIADNCPSSQNSVIEAACALLGQKPPPVLQMAEAGLSPAAQAFYTENRRIANGKARRILGWKPLYPDFETGLRALRAMAIPASPSAPPDTASKDH
ncbi:MAG: SDR family NAD(P)-dependent oxidoreductase [Sphingomonadaceae bacterium]